MAPRFDLEALRLELSVADLLEGSLLRSLGFSNRGGYERLWLGQAIHGRYQEEALAGDPTYRREVAVAATFPHRGWEVRVAGRIDGLRRQEDGTAVVEEIKSVRRGGGLSAALRELYERQALLYAWILRRSGEQKVRAELVLIEIGGEGMDREVLEADFEALEAGIRRRLDSLIAHFAAEEAESARRRQAAGRLPFPHAAPRPGQGEIGRAVATALEQREHLLLEAPTGIGKTAAALHPTLRYALAHDKRVFVLTAKTLQQEMATAVLDLVNAEGAFRTLRLRAKAKMCANDQVLCHEEYCPYARDYALKLHTSGLVDRLLGEAGTLLPDPIFAAAKGEEVCPFEVSLELSGRVQVVVCDYNYAFDPYVGLRDFGAEADLSDAVLIIDEIHNLVERGRGYYSPELGSARVRAAARQAAAEPGPASGRIAELCGELAELIEGAVAGALEEASGEARAAEAPLPEEELWSLRGAFDAAFVDYLEHRRETKTFRAEDPFVTLYFDLLRFLHALTVADGAFSRCLELADGEARLRILCKDPSRFLGSILNRAHSAIGMSATLSPPEFYRDLLGFDPQRTAAVSVPSPFPREHRRVVIDDSVATAWRQRPGNYPRIAQRLSELAQVVPGNCLALFPSYQFLSEVAGRLRIPGKRVLIQRRADSDEEREAILATLRSAVLGDVLLLAVAGGVFAEGVDYPGEVLKAVAVVGPCLPAVCLERELLRTYYEERYGRGFEYAFAIPGMTRVVQAAGRLIRSADDTGVIALFGRRFLASPYRDHLPADWLPPGGAAALAGDPGAAAAEFFRTGSRMEA